MKGEFINHMKGLLVGCDGELERRWRVPSVVQVETYGLHGKLDQVVRVVWGDRGAGGRVATG